MKTVILTPILLFLLACNSNSKEVVTPTSTVAAKDFAADSMAKWTKNILPMPNTITSDTVNFTDANGLKQGKWIIFTGKEVKTEFYRDGKLLENC